MQRLAEALRARLAGRVETDRPLAPLTTYRLGGRAALYVEPEDEADLEALAELIAGLDIPVLAMGRGSNLVISDEGWPGLVVRTAGGMAAIEQSPEGPVIAGAGVPLPTLANWVARRSLAGLEWAVGVPGAVGGGVRMNAGAHGTQLSDVLVSVRVYDLRSGRCDEMAAAALDLSYRHSALVDGQVVVEARFQLEPDDPAAIKERVSTYRKHRAETQPGASRTREASSRTPPEILPAGSSRLAA